LIENAVKQGVAHSSRPVTITIRARAHGDSVLLSVEDDADGGAFSAHGDGVGLSNVEGRLAARFDGAAHSRHGARDGGGFRVDLTMPLMRDA